MQSLSSQKIFFEKNLNYYAPVTLSLITLNLVLFLFLYADGLLSHEGYLRSGALYAPLVREGEVWRLFTAIFLHADMEHLLSNCLMLYIAGLGCEQALGRLPFLMVYMISGIMANIFSLFFLSDIISLGASGAIFGIIGALVVFFYQYRNIYTVHDKRIGFVFLIWSVYSFLTAMVDPYINNTAHISGFACGGVTQFFFRFGKNKNFCCGPPANNL